ncbi:unnamed protein product [Owenia fusiformis]|uniref:Uncharacterized protein n=1 Tax=Owenia fusiformis TaxID=6347 RepID=A0A8J1XW84_OWEFU|nr:unnamed protein product [Owenia fusiformis]
MAYLGDFKTWCLTQGLNDNTLQILLDKGFTNINTLRLVTQPLLDTELKIEPLGQHLLLKEAIRKLWLTSAHGGAGGTPIGGSTVPGQSYNDPPPAYNTLALAFNTIKIVNMAPGTGESFPMETFSTSKNAQPPLPGVHPLPTSMAASQAQSSLHQHNQSQGNQSLHKDNQLVHQYRPHNQLRKKQIPKPKNTAKVVHAQATIEDKIAVATEQHPQKHSKTQLTEGATPAATHAAEFVHTHTTIEDKITVATEQHPQKQPKQKPQISYNNPYIKGMTDLTWLSILFCFALLGTSIAAAIYKTSTWKYFNGAWSFILIVFAIINECKIKDSLQDTRAGNKVVARYFKIMSVFLHLTLPICLAMMAMAAYGMYIDREIHIYGKPCDHHIITIMLELKCEHNATSDTTHAYIVGWNTLQAIHTANIVLAYVVFVIVIWALYARYDFVNGRPPITFTDDKERRFIKTSFLFKLTPISFPFLSIIEVIFKTSMWQLFLPAISGCILLISGFHAHNLHFLPEGVQKKKRCKRQIVLLIFSMLACIAMVCVHVSGLFLDNDIHEYGISCDEDYIRYFDYTCELEKTADGSDFITHAYLSHENLNYKQVIHLCIVVLGGLHIMCLFYAVNAGVSFWKKNEAKFNLKESEQI